MNKLSTKLAISFFLVVLIMESILMYYLHRSMINTRVEEEFSLLLANGANHRDVLVENYSEITLKHISLMEQNGNREVMITNKTGDIISSSASSHMIQEEYQFIIKDLHNKKDEIIVSEWRSSPYIISVHPYKVDKERYGYVLMLQNTSSLNQMVDKMNMHFVLSGITGFVALFIVYIMLSKIITRPLMRMKEATEKLSKGDFKVSLLNLGKDELGELAGSIHKLANDLERLQNDRNEFLAAIAHELSTPLTYLIGYSKIAMREGTSEKERQHYIEIIGEEANRMKDLVKNLMDLARMNETAFDVSKETFLVRSFLENVCQLVASSYSLKKIKLELICDEQLQIYSDRTRLEQTVLNLLDNALKYSNENSVVTLKAEQNNEKIVISVKDTGIGIPAEEIEYIFEKLYRVEKSRSRTNGGSGIGLAIVKELVSALGGTIEVTSKVGEGSTFTITI
ncbi:HAMP domain-containing sensor histidine kinase [Bacillus ndiopicus]|uniref:HAMP domain-containing sensor histidine kinase n=1 Tax=Bacillus ndiopicus TaxID=1347368 RepID=UPI0005A699F2|nr:HAMP domain-containing sensor histidine kinase [Bacillus ndiopicus]